MFHGVFWVFLGDLRYFLGVYRCVWLFYDVFWVFLGCFGFFSGCFRCSLGVFGCFQVFSGVFRVFSGVSGCFGVFLPYSYSLFDMIFPETPHLFLNIEL